MIRAENILKDVAYLSQTIGVRLSGSSQEKSAAEYLQKRFLEYAPECVIETFPTVCSDVDVTVQMRIGDTWHDLPALRFNLTPVEAFLEAHVVYWDTHTDYQRQDLSALTGKAVLHWGFVQTEADYIRLMAAKPAFLMIVDTRLPVDTPIANSLLPAWVKRHGAVPTVDVSYKTAWQIMRHTPDLARLQMTGATYPGISYNVIATIPGTDPEAGILYFGGHMDSVVGSAGADDNALGCAIILELARAFAQTSHKHTLRFIAFGTEEQLSVGSAMYLRQHREEIEAKGLFMCNFDSCGSLLGWNQFCVNADDAMAERIQKTLNEMDIYYVSCREPNPYLDQFPFTVAGIPGISFMRRNCESGSFYHHQPENTLENISGPVAEQLTKAAYALTAPIADGLLQGFTADPAGQDRLEALWESEYGG